MRGIRMAAMAVVLLPAVAEAATVFELEGSSDDSLTTIILPEMDGFTLTVSGFDDDYVGTTGAGTPGAINRNGEGWGVNQSSGNEAGRLVNGEALVFALAGPGTFDALSVYRETDDLDAGFQIVLDQMLIGSVDITATVGQDGTGAFDLGGLFADPLIGQVLAVIATGTNGSGPRGFRVSSVTVSDVPIPLPVLLLATGLAGLALVGRRS